MEVYGNFKDYYNFNDSSLRLLPLLSSSSLRSFLLSHCTNDGGETIVVVDMGCNVGELTLQLYDLLEEQLREIKSGQTIDFDTNDTPSPSKSELKGNELFKRKRSVYENENVKLVEEEREEEREKEEKTKETSQPHVNTPHLAILGIDLDGSLIARANSKVLLL